MKTAVIKILKKIEIDFNNQGAFEKKVHLDTFNELVQQISHLPFKTWQSVISQSPDVEGRLNQLTSRSIVMTIGDLNNIFPGGFKDNTNSNEIKFENTRLRIIESDISNINSHKIEIDFFFPEMTLIDSFENKIIVSPGNQFNALLAGEMINTFIISLDSSISIYSYKSI